MGARTHIPLTRVLPDALVIGAQRSGTSSLYKYLEAHPQLMPSIRKETEYFTFWFDKGDRWYRSHFPTQARMAAARRGGRPAQAFEATPYYLFHPHAPERAAAVVPHARLVAVLRNPVERAYSHWQHEVRGGRESLSFEEAIDAEPERVDTEERRLQNDPSYRSNRHHRFSYVGRGRYAMQLERWLAHYPREQLLVVRSEDLYADPASTFLRIVEHMGVDQWEPAEFRNHSYEGLRPEAGPPMAPATRTRLEATFEADNERLARLLERPAMWS
ncbi:MAG: hypothetical protein QOE35_1797 [Actinomycetota bacterium]